MKKIIIAISLFSFSSMASVNINKCFDLSGDIRMVLLVSLQQDIGIKKSYLETTASRFKILRNEPVNFTIAKTFGEIEMGIGDEDSTNPMTADEYAKGFMRDNSRNIIVEYTFTNKKGLKDVFLVSAFISDDSCVVRFNGYLIAKREF